MPGRSTLDRSICPHCCGRYHAAVKSGAVPLVMLSGVTPLVSNEVEQVEVVALMAAGAPAVQLVVAVGITPASFPSIPLAVAMTVSGCSAENDSEAPHQAGIVQRTCGIRT